MKRKKKEETYTLTPKGLISLSTSRNPEDVWDDIVLFCYRHDFNAILIDKKGGHFTKIQENWA